ncbi:hypothetical protein Tco_0430898 [Tanacetum coccineum]
MNKCMTVVGSPLSYGYLGRSATQTNDSKILGKLKLNRHWVLVGLRTNRKGWTKSTNTTDPSNKETIHTFPTDLRCLIVPVVPPHGHINRNPSVSISSDNEEPSSSHSSSSSAHQSSLVHHSVATKHFFEVNPFAATEHEPFVNVFAPDPNSEASSSGTLTIPTPNQSTQPH